MKHSVNHYILYIISKVSEEGMKGRVLSSYYLQEYNKLLEVSQTVFKST